MTQLSPTTRSFLNYLIAPAFTTLITMFVVIPVTTFHLEPRDFGVVAILGAVLAPIGPLSAMGGTWVLGGHYFRLSTGERKELVFNVLAVDFALRLAWVLVLGALAPYVLPWVVGDFSPDYILYFRIMLLSTLLLSLWPTVSYLLVLQKRSGLHARVELAQFSVGAIFTIIGVAAMGLSVLGLVIGGLAAALTSFVIAIFCVAQEAAPHLRRRWLAEVVRLGAPSIPVNLCEIVSSVSDRYFIQKWLDLGQLGIYAHSVQYKTGFTLGSKAFARTFSPYALDAFSGQRSDPRLDRLLKTWFSLVTAGGVFVCFLAQDLVDLLTHRKFSAAAPLVPIWFLFIASFAFGGPYAQFMLASQRSRLVAALNVAIGLASIVLTGIAVYLWGILGAALSLLLGNIMLQLATRFYALRNGCTRLGDKYFAMCILTICCAYAVAFYGGLGLWPRLAIAAGTAAIIAVATDLVRLVRQI